MRKAWQHDIDYSKRQREPGVLIGVRQICRYMRISAPTFYKYHQEYGLPAMRLPGRGSRWCTSKNLIDEWIISRWKGQTVRSGDRSGHTPVSAG